MNEQALEELKKVVGQPDPDYERVWAERMKAQLIAEEAKLQSAFKMWCFVRDDQRIAEVAANLQRTRDCLTYVNSVLENDADSSPDEE